MAVMLAVTSLLFLLGSATELPATSVAAAPGAVEPEAVYYADEQIVDWYGLETFAVDAAAVALVAAGASLDSEELVGAGLITAGLGAPILHASKGRAGAAAGSVALRLGATVLLANLGASADCEGEFCALGNAALGAMAGYGAAALVDALFLSRATRTERRPRYVPRFTASAAGATVGVAGAF
jgi:hypothetical protein